MGDQSTIERAPVVLDRTMMFHVRAIKGAARRLGMPAHEYAARVVERQKWCTACKDWHPTFAFALDRSRSDGLKASCTDADRLRYQRTYVRKVNPGPFGPRPAPARDGDKEQARRRVNVLVRTGRLAHPNTRPCADCGHVWAPGERRHEYDHFAGYGPDAHLLVEAVCTTHHAQRGVRRREDLRVREYPA